MEQCKGLIAGIDIGYSKIQASVYSYNSRNVQTVKLTEDSKEYWIYDTICRDLLLLNT